MNIDGLVKHSRSKNQIRHQEDDLPWRQSFRGVRQPRARSLPAEMYETATKQR